jgi:predicted nucleotidyltransferase
VVFVCTATLGALVVALAVLAVVFGELEEPPHAVNPPPANMPAASSDRAGR